MFLFDLFGISVCCFKDTLEYVSDSVLWWNFKCLISHKTIGYDDSNYFRLVEIYGHYTMKCLEIKKGYESQPPCYDLKVILWMRWFI